MSLSHTFNTIAGGKNTASTGGVGGNDYPTTGESVLDKESPNDTAQCNMFALGTDGDSASADADVYFDFFYDAIGGGLTIRTTDNGSSASGTSSFTEDEDADYYPVSGGSGSYLNSARTHYYNDSSVSGESYPGAADYIKIVHSKTTVQDLGTTTETLSMQKYHYSGTGSPASLGTYTNDTWFGLHNIGGQSGVDVPTDSVGIRVRMNNFASSSGNSQSRMNTDHTIECWVKAIGGANDTKLFEYKLSLVARADSTF